MMNRAYWMLMDFWCWLFGHRIVTSFSLTGCATCGRRFQ